MKKHVTIAVVLTFLLSAAVSAWAGGFALYEYSARGNSMGGALAALADDPSAVAFNPAGITQLPGSNLMLGASFVTPNSDVELTNPYTGQVSNTCTESNTFFLPHFYFTQQMTEDLYLGIGMFPRFGLGTEYDEAWPGRYNIYNVAVQSMSVTPVVAYKVTDQLSLSVGMEGMWFDMNIQRYIDANLILAAKGAPVTVNDPDSYTLDVDSEHHGDGIGFGFNAGVHYAFSEKLAAGLMYRSRVEQELDGTVEFDRTAAVESVLGQAVFNDSDISGSVTLPDHIQGGVAYRPIDDLVIELDVAYILWSTYTDLTIEYDSLGAIGAPEKKSEKDWKDTWRFMLGVEYNLFDWLDLRTGYIYDQCPINDDYADYLVPANDYQYLDFGVGMHYGAWTFDLSYRYLWSVDREIDPRITEGIYDTNIDNSYAHVFGLMASYQF